jgi:hypothetical protein
MIHENVLQYRGARYFWWAAAIVVASVALYLTQGELQPPNGGTWQGYVLGTLGAALIVWLALLGIRKRRYASRLGTVHGWASAHVYLGTAVLIVGTLHSAFELGWNVHTLAWVLMVVVVLSGFYGLYAYLEHPRRLAGIRSGSARERLFGELFELDRRTQTLAAQCAADVEAAVTSAIARTSLGGGVTSQLLAIDRSQFLRPGGSGESAAPTRNTDQQAVIAYVADRAPRAEKRTEAANLQALLSLLARRQAVLRRIRRDVQLEGWLKAWLYVHVPLTIALIGALAVHIVATFLYW